MALLRGCFGGCGDSRSRGGGRGPNALSLPLPSAPRNSDLDGIRGMSPSIQDDAGRVKASSGPAGVVGSRIGAQEGWRVAFRAALRAFSTCPIPEDLGRPSQLGTCWPFALVRHPQPGMSFLAGLDGRKAPANPASRPRPAVWGLQRGSSGIGQVQVFPPAFGQDLTLSLG